MKGLAGQVVGVVSIASWLGMTVYFMSRAAATLNSDGTLVTDQGNWFAGFVVLTLVFIAIMVFWRRMFGEQH